MVPDYKPSPFYRTPFGIGLVVLALIIFGIFGWDEMQSPSQLSKASDSAVTPSGTNKP